MDNDQPKDPSGQFDASLPLPTGGQPVHFGPPQDNKPEDANPTADLIRQKVEAAYANEPDPVAEEQEVEQLGPTTHFSKHQQFINTLSNSGKSLADVQTAWHEYYQGLSDAEKHEVWREFYAMHAATSHYAAATGQAVPATQAQPAAVAQPSKHTPKATKPLAKTMGELRTHVLKNAHHVKTHKLPRHVQSLLFGLAAGAGAVLIILFSFFNERFIAPFIQPSRTVTNTPLISDASVVGTAPEIIIPKINVQIPVVYGVNTIEETVVQKALEDGVVHYADTALPGQNGNGVIVGHSSNNIFNKGKYKFAFVLLSRLEKGDTFYLQKDGKRYTYQVYEKKIVAPNDASVLGTADKPATVSLITCDPPGTSINRLVVVGEQISPDLASNSAQTTKNTLATQTKIVPGNSQSLWARMTKWLFP